MRNTKQSQTKRNKQAYERQKRDSLNICRRTQEAQVGKTKKKTEDKLKETQKECKKRMLKQQKKR